MTEMAWVGRSAKRKASGDRTKSGQLLIRAAEGKTIEKKGRRKGMGGGTWGNN